MGNNVCCALSSPGCKVQVQEEAGTTFVDAVNQRTRFDPFGSPRSVVTVYKDQKQYLVSNNTCVSYCPLQNDNWVSFGPSVNATNVGQKKFNGVECTDWNWKETILGVITMEIDDFFVDAAGNPIGQSSIITPFGKPLGSESSVYTNFKAGVPAASNWDIKGLAQCQQGQNCDSNNSDLMRSLIKNKQWKSWMFYKYGKAY